MAQYSRPSSDVSATGWNLSTGSSYYALIDESVPNDADYIYATSASIGTVEVKCSTVSTPGTGSRTLLVRWCDNWSGGLDPSWSSDCEISLVDGTTVLHTFQDTPPHQATYADQYFDITAYNPSAWNDLRVRLKKGGGGNGMYVSQVYIQVPDATSSGSFTILDASGGSSRGRTFDWPLQAGKSWPDYVVEDPSYYDYNPGPHYYEYPYDRADAINGGIDARTGMWAPAHCLTPTPWGLMIGEFAPTERPPVSFRRQR